MPKLQPPEPLPEPLPEPSPEQLVAHPRFGALPRPSGLSVTDEELCRGHWSVGYDTRFVQTVLRADIAKQNYCLYPRKYYVDVQRQCRTCQRPFIFFAEEQRYWFETLRFHVDAQRMHCTDCSNARRPGREAQRRVRQFNGLAAKAAHTPSDFEELVDAALYLLESGTLRNLNTLGALKNKALKVIPGYQGTLDLAGALARAAAQQVQSKTHPVSPAEATQH
jgi:hypothetical protein